MAQQLMGLWDQIKQAGNLKQTRQLLEGLVVCCTMPRIETAHIHVALLQLLPCHVRNVLGLEVVWAVHCKQHRHCILDLGLLEALLDDLFVPRGLAKPSSISRGLVVVLVLILQTHPANGNWKCWGWRSWRPCKRRHWRSTSPGRRRIRRPKSQCRLLNVKGFYMIYKASTVSIVLGICIQACIESVGLA